MTTTTRDPLLTAARTMVILITIVLIVSLVLIGIGTGALLTVGQGELWDRIAAADAPRIAYWAVIAAFALVAAAISLAIKFFQLLQQIVVSVEEGEPFSSKNAERLRHMGWLTVAGQVLMLPLAAIGSWLAPYLDRLGETYELDLGLDPGAILLILVLFILARVFERGAQLRSDVEGTV